MTHPITDQRLRQREREARWDRTLYAVESVPGAVAALAIVTGLVLAVVYVMTAGGV
jgi:predicted hydrolase (HD superfamily)